MQLPEPYKTLRKKGIQSAPFRIPYNSYRFEGPLTDLLVKWGVDKSYVPQILKRLEFASRRTWYHRNSSYNSFKWDIQNIDKYVEGLYYIEGETVCQPDKKLQQAIKRLIECYQINFARPASYTYDNSDSDSPSIDFDDLEVEEEKVVEKPQLVIHLNLKDKEQFFEFLRNRPINRQTRERYNEEFPFPKDPSNKSNRSSFVEKQVSFDTNDVQVYVNGELSSDVICRVEEFDDAYIVHLFYKGERAYSKSFSIDKELAKEPIHHINYNEDNSSLDVNGKNLAITFSGYDEYKRFLSGKPKRELSDEPSHVYVGEPIKEHKTKIAKETSVTKTDNEVKVVIDDFKETKKQEPETPNAKSNKSKGTKTVNKKTKTTTKKKVSKKKTDSDDEDFDDIFEKPAKTKICFRCQRELPLSKFDRTIYAFDGREAYCKECWEEIRRIKEMKEGASDFAILRRNNKKRIIKAIAIVAAVVFVIWLDSEFPILFTLLLVLIVLFL